MPHPAYNEPLYPLITPHAGIQMDHVSTSQSQQQEPETKIKVAKVILITHLVGMVTFIPHLVSLYLSYKNKSSKYTIVFCISELIACLFLIGVSIYFLYGCGIYDDSNSSDPGDKCILSGASLWLFCCLTCGLARVIAIWKKAQIKN